MARAVEQMFSKMIGLRGSQMAFLGIKRKIAAFGVNHLFVGVKHFEKKRHLLNWIGCKIGEGTKIVGPITCTADLEIGRNCWIGKNFIINGNGFVKIGDNCDIAPEVIIQTGGHEIGTPERRAGKGIRFSVTVGDGCWIGARSTLLGGVSIGDGCVVAACACVAKTVEDNTMVGGVPARVIKNLSGEES